MQTGRYILLPRDGVRSLRRGDDTLFRVYQRFNQGDSLSAEMFGAANRPFNVVDSANEDGAKLAEMDVATAEAINSSRSSVRALPEIIHPHPKDRLIVATRSAVSAAMPVIIRCEDATTGQPLPGQHVIAFTNFFARQGDESTTDAAGNALLHLSGGTIERLFVVPRNGYWGSFRAGIPVQPRITVGIEPLVPTYRDSIVSGRRSTSSSPLIAVV